MSATASPFSPDEQKTFDARTSAIFAKYPPERRSAALIPVLHVAQEIRGWLPPEILSYVATVVAVPPSRVAEVTTFYTMLHLKPVGKTHVQVCVNLSCWLRGSDAVMAACKKHIHAHAETVSDDGKLSWMEVECLGACVNAPAVQIGDDFYEDLDGARMEGMINDLRAGRAVKPGSQIGRQNSAPEGGPMTLLDVKS